MTKIYSKLLDEAKKALKNSYSPYSKFKTGAAVLTDKGKIFSGSNVENSSYGLTVCAERNAIFKAVNAGNRNFKALAVVCSGKSDCFPCGACLQVISEFSKNIEIILQNKRKIKIYSLKELLPYSFKFKK